MTVFDPIEAQTVEVLAQQAGHEQDEDGEPELAPIIRPGAVWRNGVCLTPLNELVGMDGVPPAAAEAPPSATDTLDAIEARALREAAACSPMLYAVVQAIMRMREAPGYGDLLEWMEDGARLQAEGALGEDSDPLCDAARTDSGITLYDGGADAEPAAEKPVRVARDQHANRRARP